MTMTYRDQRNVFAERSDWNLPHVLRTRAQSHADQVYLDVPFENVRYSYAETLAIAERIGSGLLADGCVAGDRILIMAPNGSAYILGWFGSALAGMAEVPINNAYRGAFLEHQVRTTAPAAAIIHTDYVERFVESADACRCIQRFYLVGAAEAIAPAAAQLAQAGFAAGPFSALLDAPAGPLPSPRMQDLASVFFTSGTTGLSKGVQMTHAHMYFFADECVSLTRCTDTDAYMVTGPLFHGNAQFLGAYPALIAGARFVLQSRFSTTQWIDQIRDSGATITNFVGVMMDFVWRQPERVDDANNALRCIFAAPTASSILDGFKARFGVEAFVEVFGLTETSMPIMSPYGVDRPAGAAGLLNEDFFDIRLVDSDTDEEVPVGEVGELVVRAKIPWITTIGYYGMPDKTAEVFRNLWFHTGDGLRRDEDGWYYFVDRLKDALRRRGENISSYEVEQAILALPEVHEVAVVAVPADSEAGEDEVLAAIVLAEGATLDAVTFWAHCDKRLPYFAVPRYVRFTDALPKTPSEKVRKIELREAGVTSDTSDRNVLEPGAGGRPAR
ncbi:MAG: AMP-binding protein [Acidimicrobiia bacterium]